jgi:hypothetical protein
MRALFGPGVTLRSAVASDGSYLYLHSSSGLAKLGTGYNGTFAGHLYVSKPRYRASEKPWVACVGNRLYMRSQAMSPDCLVVLDCADLSEIGSIKQDGEGSVPSPNAGSAMYPEQSPGGGTGSGVGGGGSGGGSGGGRRLWGWKWWWEGRRGRRFRAVA